jgi:hypothetical protein
MSSYYSGFFVRDALGDTPNQPGSGPWTASPDIILAGTEPAQAAQYATPQGYATDYGATAYVNTPNFLYARALNASPGALTGRVWFYTVPSDLALWPQNWSGNGIMVGSQQVSYQDIAATQANEVSQPDLPFLWQTPQPQPGAHFVTLIWIENDPVEPPTSPAASLPAFPTFDDLAEFILTHPNIGLRDTVASPVPA